MKAKWLVGVAMLASVVTAPLGALSAAEPRTIELAVTKNGFEPARLKVTKGVPLKLVITRKTDETCAKEVVIPDQNINAELPLNKPVALSFTPKRSGEIRYACGMNMITGIIEVASGDEPAPDERRATQLERHGSDAMSGMAGHDATPEGASHRMHCGCMHGEADRANGS